MADPPKRTPHQSVPSDLPGRLADNDDDIDDINDTTTTTTTATTTTTTTTTTATTTRVSGRTCPGA